MNWILDAEDEETKQLFVSSFTPVIQSCHIYQCYKFDQLMHVDSTSGQKTKPLLF